MKHYIYILKCPDTLKPMYVGETSNPKGRLNTHIGNHQGTRKCDWVKSLLEAGKKPIMEIIEETTRDLKKERELYWIEWYRDNGFEILNMERGGFRFGGGRKHKYGNEPTAPIRVPTSKVPAIERWIRIQLAIAKKKK